MGYQVVGGEGEKARQTIGVEDTKTWYLPRSERILCIDLWARWRALTRAEPVWLQLPLGTSIVT